jgi:hypothetical protein
MNGEKSLRARKEQKLGCRGVARDSILPVLMKPTGLYPDGYQDTETNKKQNATSGINLAENLTREHGVKFGYRCGIVQDIVNERKRARSLGGAVARSKQQ